MQHWLLAAALNRVLVPQLRWWFGPYYFHGNKRVKVSTADRGRKQDPRKRKHDTKWNGSPKQVRSARIAAEECVQNHEIRRSNGMLFICRKGHESWSDWKVHWWTVLIASRPDEWAVIISPLRANRMANGRPGGAWKMAKITQDANHPLRLNRPVPSFEYQSLAIEYLTNRYCTLEVGFIEGVYKTQTATSRWPCGLSTTSWKLSKISKPKVIKCYRSMCTRACVCVYV